MDARLGLGIFMLCWFFAFAFLFQRFLYRIRRRRGYYPTTGSLGNALQNLQSMAQPQVVHILQEKQSDKAEDDESGGPAEP